MNRDECLGTIYNARAKGERPDLSGADLRGADLSYTAGIELALAQASHLPSDGPIIGWKKLANGKIAKLQIPAKAKRSYGASRKCRASEAKVLAIFEADGKTEAKSGVSQHDDRFVYAVGKTVKPTEPFDEDRWDECASGIHFFHHSHRSGELLK